MSNSIEFSPEITRAVNMVTKNDIYPKICIGKKDVISIIDYKIFTSMIKSEELFKQLKTNNIAFKIPETKKPQTETPKDNLPKQDKESQQRNIHKVKEIDQVTLAKINKFLKPDRVTMFS